MSTVNIIAYAPAWFTVLIQLLFGAAEMFNARRVFEGAFPDTYRQNATSPVWAETEKLARNMGLYNWFLALGLLLSLIGWLGDARTSLFFLLCVAVAGVFGLLSVRLSIAFWAQLLLGLAAFVLFQRF